VLPVKFFGIVRSLFKGVLRRQNRPPSLTQRVNRQRPFSRHQAVGYPPRATQFAGRSSFVSIADSDRSSLDSNRSCYTVGHTQVATAAAAHSAHSNSAAAGPKSASATARRRRINHTCSEWFGRKRSISSSQC